MSTHLITPSMWPLERQRRDRRTEFLRQQAESHPIYLATKHLPLAQALVEIERLQREATCDQQPEAPK